MDQQMETGQVGEEKIPQIIPAPAKKLRLGEMLLEAGAITEEQLDEALRIQKEADPPKKLGEILIKQRYTSQQRIKDVVKTNAKNFRLGELLMALDLLTYEQLEESLAHQKENPGMRLGEAIIAMHFITERLMLMTLSYQLDLPYIEPDINLIDRSLIGRMSRPYLQRLEAIPVFCDETSVTVVTQDPSRDDIAKEFKSLFGKDIHLAIGPKAEILQTIDDFDRLFKNSDDKNDKEAKGAKPEDENVIGIVEYIFTKAIRQNASDIHIEPMKNRLRIRYRIDGVLIHKTDLPLYLGRKIASRIKILCEGDIVERRKHQGGRILFETDGMSVDMRVSIYVTIHGENVVLRVLNSETGILPLEKMGMLRSNLQHYKENVLDVPTGVVLITGPTGSGKTTTLYSSIDYCNNMDTKIITAEDPVEFVIEGIIQCSIDTKAGRSFDNSLREIVRQDPDIIVLGEIRDKETARIAIQAALTGHKVYATFHTEDAIGGLLRLIDMDIETFLISSTVVCVIAQRLVRRICENCRTITEPTPYELRLLGLDEEYPTKKYPFFKGAGCHMCSDSGYKGRVGIYEMLLLDDSVRSAILAKQPANEVRELARISGDMFLMQEDGIVKALLGHTTLEEVILHAPRNYKQHTLEEMYEVSMLNQ